MPLPLPPAAARIARSATVGWTAYTLYRGYRATQQRVATLPESQREAAWDHQHDLAARRIARKAVRLRGLYVKAAQFLGVRADLLPEPYITHLSALHDHVPPRPYREMRGVLRRALGAEPEQVFAKFSRRPVAAASLAQVHRAVLRDGRRVAVKVQYPDIERLVHLDLRNLMLILRLLHRSQPNLDLTPLADALGRLIPRELDFVAEGRTTETIGAALAHRGDVTTAPVIWEHTSRTVLVTEYLDGVKISDAKGVRGLGYDPKQLVERVIDVWGEQVLRVGRFHADPHPGNILVLPDGRLGLIDFGLTAKPEPQGVRAVNDLTHAVARGDMLGIVRAFRGLGFHTPDDNPSAYFSMSGRLFNRESGPDSVNVRLAQALRGFRLQDVPGETLLVMRVLGLLHGLGALYGRSGPVLPAWLPYATIPPEPVAT